MCWSDGSQEQQTNATGHDLSYLLYEQGRFQLFDPVSKFIPAFNDLKVYEGGAGSDVNLVDLQRPVTARDLSKRTSAQTACAEAFCRSTSWPALVGWSERDSARPYLEPFCILQAEALELKEETAEMTKAGFPETFPTIETTRLILREIAQDDTNGIFKNFSDPDVAKWFFEQPLTEMDQVTEIIDEFNRDFIQGKGLTWAITLKGNGACIGTCGYGEVRSGDRGEIGFDLAKEQWGKGLMTEGLAAIIDYGFEVLNLLQVEAHTYSNNTRAIRLLEKLGFQPDDVSEDSHFFSLSREDWD